MEAVLLSARGLGKVYRMGEVEVHALHDVDLDLHVGDLVIVVGPSGSGKTTLLNLLGGMDRPTSGRLEFLGEDLARASERRLTLYRRNDVGFVFQFYNLVPTLTALENIEVATEICPRPMEPREALAMVGLEDRAGFFPAQLSGGQQQRVAVARAIASNPRLLLCDEPTGNLDSVTGRQILDLLVDVNQRFGVTVVIITHSQAVARVGRHVAFMQDGAIASWHENGIPEVAW